MVKRKSRVKRRAKTSRIRSRVRKPAPPRAIELALAGIAHDIRTPLTGIVALAELLASSDLGTREREWAKAIKSGADHLAALTTLIVDAAVSETCGLTLRHEPFSPRALAEAVGEALAARAGNKNIKVDIVLAGDLPALVAGDALRLRAALENLLDNAVKFTEDKVSFTVAAEPAGRGRVRLVFTVSDNGIGMSAGEMKLLFRPFAQASSEIARHYGGTGLGLSFVKRFAEAIGGDLHLTSRPGRGSTFRLTVPVAIADVQPVAETGKSRGGRTRPLTILCAEDNPYGRVVMNTILTELGHHVDFVESGEAVVKAAERGGYDAVLMDVTLSGIDGIEATRRIRALAGAMPVIGISGHNDSGVEQAARAAGMNFFFTKPVSPGRLAEALNNLASTEEVGEDDV